ncbi:putative methylthioadenine synthetase [Desulfamplus magnetovallimortis]|uniref:tRNA (N(6)-L-threonylcarbamoyladenosine(37)-C(2))-methylthiotransferase n=1 Tax=Desulfamplus magnetovallimortis TaxID=1246637 RepID=A0A1W1H5K2_9BACT|nr:tRNA (N(6)-L-threonylcarbamoyladenosine(37)-C(2))-methylthiotransferase MtaB [Desulfamplus magnetovallimortis]SLM27732.1 putative methylthioadenine synthetase [Desulfamplus magnetovallimortis]
MNNIANEKYRTFYITTLGCKVNQYESDGIAAELSAMGWSRSEKCENAEICIINTCSVTSKAAMQSRQQIRSIIRANPKARVVVTGCHAQTAPDDIKKIEQVDIITGHSDKFNIARAISEENSITEEIYISKKVSHGKNKNNTDINRSPDGDKKRPGLITENIPFPASNSCTETVFHSFSPSVTGNKTRAYLKIQDGCNAFCSYCIVPYARGRSRSMPQEEVFRHLYKLSSLGYKEAIITGIHVGAYGLDFKDKSSLTELLEKIERHRPIHRVRLSSIEPCELTPEIIAIASQKQSILCNHFHIPLQSGDDQILKRMKRPYSASLFHSLVTNINQSMPSAGIGADILVGFPGESQAAFDNTFSLMEKLPVTYLHVFPFSPRKGTPAFDFPNKVDSKTVKQRCALIRKLGSDKRKAFETRQIGELLEAVIQENRDTKTGKLVAVTSNYLSVLVDGEDSFKGQCANVIIESRQKDNRLYGKIL